MTTTDPKLIERIARALDSRSEWLLPEEVNGLAQAILPIVAAAINEAAHQWQDIATAPRDGEAILLYKPDERMVGEYIIAGYWGEWPGVGEGWIACDGKPQGYYSHTAEARQGFPTHWMPLPSPPAIEAKESQP